MTVHTWANKETRGTLRIRLKCSNNRRTKCKFSFQLCFGLAEGFWYLRRGSGNHVHNGHELDPPKIGVRKTAESVVGQKRDASMGSLTSSSASKEPRSLNQYGAAPLSGVAGGSGSFSSGAGSFSYGVGYQQSQQFPQQGVLPQHMALQQASIHSFPAGSTTDMMRQASFAAHGAYPYGSMGNSIHGSFMPPPGANSFSMSGTFSAAPRPSNSFHTMGHSIDEMNAASSMLGLPGTNRPPIPPPPPPQRPSEVRQVSSEAEERRKKFLAASGALPSAEDRRKKFLATSTEHSQFPSNNRGPQNNSQRNETHSNKRGALEDTTKAPPPPIGKASSVDFMYSSSDLTHAIGDEMKDGKIDIMSSTTNIFGDNPRSGEKARGKDESPDDKNSSQKKTDPNGSKSELSSNEKKRGWEGNPGKLSDFTEQQAQAPLTKKKRSIFMNSRDLVEDILEQESKKSGDAFSVPTPRPPVGRDPSALDFISKTGLDVSHGLSSFKASEREGNALDSLPKNRPLASEALANDPDSLKQSFLQEAHDLLMANEEVQALLGTPLKPSPSPLWEKVTKISTPKDSTQIELSLTISGSSGAGVAYVVGRDDVGLETLRVTTASGADSVNVIPKATKPSSTKGNTARAKFLATTSSRPLGGLADHTSAIPLSIAVKPTTAKARQSGALDDFTSAPSRVTKETKGANMYSSIGSFAFSSAGSLNESVDDLDKLEGFGGSPHDNKDPKKGAVIDTKSHAKDGLGETAVSTGVSEKTSDKTAEEALQGSAEEALQGSASESTNNQKSSDVEGKEDDD